MGMNQILKAQAAKLWMTGLGLHNDAFEAQRRGIAAFEWIRAHLLGNAAVCEASAVLACEDVEQLRQALRSSWKQCINALGPDAMRPIVPDLTSTWSTDDEQLQYCHVTCKGRTTYKADGSCNIIVERTTPWTLGPCDRPRDLQILIALEAFKAARVSALAGWACARLLIATSPTVSAAREALEALSMLQPSWREREDLQRVFAWREAMGCYGAGFVRDNQGQRFTAYLTKDGQVFDPETVDEALAAGWKWANELVLKKDAPALPLPTTKSKEALLAEEDVEIAEAGFKIMDKWEAEHFSALSEDLLWVMTD